ncbi:MAG: hypothetical protein AB1757_28345 [Acidobacteriota bacterium]
MMTDKKKSQDDISSDTPNKMQPQFSSITKDRVNHPSRKLEARARGFGIAAGYEKAFNQDESKTVNRDKTVYGPIPHAGYFGAGLGLRPFKKGQAGFSNELDWYKNQYGEKTTAYDENKKK